MNKQELKQLLKDSEVKGLKIFDNEVYGIPSSTVLGLIEQLDEPEKGYAEQSPKYLKNILARLRELPLHDREIWLKAIMSEFEQEFSHAKWREGYELGKIDGMMEPEKVKIPQFVADIIEEYKEKNAPIMDIFTEKYSNKKYNNWLIRSLNAYDRAARAWLDGYEIEKTKEALYTVTLKSSGQKLCYHEKDDEYLFSSHDKCFLKDTHTRKELEEVGLDWMFSCESMDVQEYERREV